jgi:hypothetical protein
MVVGKPYEGKPHVRFDAAGAGDGQIAPRQLPTLLRRSAFAPRDQAKHNPWLCFPGAAHADDRAVTPDAFAALPRHQSRQPLQRYDLDTLIIECRVISAEELRGGLESMLRVLGSASQGVVNHTKESLLITLG